MAKSLALDFLPEELILKLQKKRKRVHKPCSVGCGHSKDVGERLRTNSPLHEQDAMTDTSSDVLQHEYFSTTGALQEDFSLHRSKQARTFCLNGNVKQNKSTRTSRSPPLCPGLSLSAFRRPETTVRLLRDRDITARLDADYDLSKGGRILGHGASSIVRLATRKSDGMRVAVKCLPKHEILRNYCLLDEFQLLRQISHPSIIRFYDVYETESDLYIVMELCDCGDLYSKIVQVGKFNEKQAKSIIRRLLLALEYLHDKNIVHRDVKPENILLSDVNDVTKVKLTDFGLAKRMMGTSKAESDEGDIGSVKGNRKRTYSRVGSDHYCAPEMYTGAGYDTAVDLFSLGVCAYVLLHGHTPPSNFGVDEEKAFEPHSFKGMSADAKDLISSLLSHNPEERPTAVAALRHPWLSNLHDDDLFPPTSVAVKNAEVLKQTVDVAAEWSASPVCLLQERENLPLLMTIPLKKTLESGCEPVASVPHARVHAEKSGSLSSTRSVLSCDEVRTLPVSREEKCPFPWEEKMYSSGQPIPRVTPR